MNEDYKGMTNALDRIDAAVRPSVTEEAVDEAFWYTRLETAVQSLVEERNRMQCEVVNSKAIAEHNQRLAMSNQRKLEEAEKELRRLRRALDAYSPEEEEMPEYIPLAVGSQRHRPLWPLR
ncbi:hypothetical protein UCRPA7_546 [Phaeoacremonium minimum UCRPA7]|uniref:Uncharacterized protein n=1 Tax=Phaeoacremonium minimum (strain UCR-PA7) TaxID=1286976 RepID=R8BWW3_PHAM7|nr:hypothetical protein UCRPA7_546 [Phaeoacremonium minimum UCRPA7]EOO03837.1 hypothetical protein UCRPA7_546 [Phaeoacremonium minimum UCRPA7]